MVERSFKASWRNAVYRLMFVQNSINMSYSRLQYWTIVVACIPWMLLSNFTFAAQPEANSLSIAGLQRGTSIELTISGVRLGDAHSILFFNPGLEATNITKIDDNSIKATITASPECACDLHPFRVVTNTGISNMRLLNVSALPTVMEKEPNSEFGTAQLVELNSTVSGVVQNEDVDYYAIDLKQGQQINVELEGLRHAYLNDFFDPYIAIYDAKRFEITASDDSIFLQQDCLCAMVAPSDGRYIIEVRESSFGGNDRCKYRLHIGTFPRPVAIIPSGGPAGQPLKTTCIDLLGNRWEETFEMPIEPTELHRVWTKRDGSISPSPNYLKVTNATNVLESEPNSDLNKVEASYPAPVAFNGILESEYDKDFWIFEGTKDQQLEIRVHARNPTRSSVDPVLQIWKVGGGVVASNDDSGGPDSYVSFKVPADGKYAVCVYDHLGRFGPYFAYRAEVLTQTPEVGTTLPEQDRYISQTVVVPRGSRMAVEATVVRKNIGGEAVILASSLPEGMAQSDGICAADLGSIPILFRGDEGAPNAGRLVDLTASIATSADNRISGPLRQRTQLVRGQNNVDVWGRFESKMAVALTDPAPFDIEVTQPQVPLVRNGSLNLTVQAKRKPGFDKPIQLRLLSNPPGIGYSAVTIPGDQSSIALPLTANNNAAIRKWPLVVMATADSGFGPIKISSEFVVVDVTDSLFEFKFTKTMAEQGKTVDVSVATKLKRPVEGTIEIEILGIPPGTQTPTPKVVFPPDGSKAVFPLQIPAETRAGNYKTIVCRATVTSEKGVVTQTNGNGEIQIDVPIAAASTAAATTKASNTGIDPAKPLSRLEQLKMQRGKQ